MLPKMFSGLALAVCLFLTCLAHADCGNSQSARYQQLDSIVHGLRLDKPGQARVYAPDGSEYTGGEVLWMRAQIKKVERLCADGSEQDQGRAAAILGELEELVRSHKRGL